MKHYQGISLIEALLAVLLSAILLGGIWPMFTAIIRSYHLQEAMASLQSNGRFVMDFLSREIRMAGFTGCLEQDGIRSVITSRDTSRQWMTLPADIGVMGYDTGRSGAGLIDSKATSPALVISRILRENSYPVSSYIDSAGTIQLLHSHNFDSGDLLALGDEQCQKIGIFKAGDETQGNRIRYQVDDGQSLHNCGRLFNNETGCLKNKTISVVRSNSLWLSPVETMAYYIRNSNGQPVLYRKRAGLSASGRSLSAEALVEGIESLHFLYGLDDNDDGTVDQYVSAQTLGDKDDQWKKVTGVRLEVVFRSLQPVLEQPQHYFFAKKTVAPSDHYLRYVMVRTVAIRNQL
ncbi:hypothetical protein CI610_00925 [invertebrate metagenome]|uniref:Type IV pilus assembly protein PilW n=1 Tax=invertebrate metagenome TaxID=1711999 RepID=A0A2H9TA90_9ZZZZ